jgi:hypothetical protein
MTPSVQEPDQLDDQLRELFQSFEVADVYSSHKPLTALDKPLTRDRAFAWAGAVAAVLALLVWLDLVVTNHSAPEASPTETPIATSHINPCTSKQLTATVVFNSIGTELGAIRLVNHGSRACSLSGQPEVEIISASGRALALDESTFQRAPDSPAGQGPVALSASGGAHQAIADLDWCGFSFKHSRISINFNGWSQPLIVRGSSVTPADFYPPACPDPSQKLFAVDPVRSTNPQEISLLAPRVSITPANDLRSDEAITVHIVDYEPSAGFFVSECPTPIDVNIHTGCGSPDTEQSLIQSYGETDNAGNGSATYYVTSDPSIAYGGTNPSERCVDQCVIIVSAMNGLIGITPIDFSTSSLSSTQGLSETPECLLSQLHLTSTSGVGTGHVVTRLRFTNIGSATCYLEGYPDVVGIDATGHPAYQTTQTLDGWGGGIGSGSTPGPVSPPLVTLWPGESASTTLSGLDGTGLTDPSSCFGYPKILVTMPHTNQRLTLNVSIYVCPVKGGGVQVTPFVAGITGLVSP